jgi:hypothetical protein
MQLVHPSTSNHEGLFCVPGSIKRSAEQGGLFQNLDIAARHGGILFKIHGSGKGGDSASNEIDARLLVVSGGW